MLRGLIFDLDGTLADTLPVAIGAFQHTFRVHLGRDYSAAEVRALFGPTEEGILRRQAPAAFAAVQRTYLAEYERRHAACRRPFDGIHDLLAELRGGGLRLGVVTGKGAASTHISLAALGLAAAFDDVETGSEAGGIKPDKIRALLDRWQLEPAGVAYVGDHPYDVESARAAGVTAVAAAWAPATDVAALVAAGPAHVCRTVAELRRWARRQAD